MDTQSAFDDLRCALLQPLADKPRRHRRHAYGPGARITYIDRAIIRQYFAGVGGDTAARSQALPDDLERSLSSLEPGLMRVLDGTDVLLVEKATRKVVDVMQHAAAVAARFDHEAHTIPEAQ